MNKILIGIVAFALWTGAVFLYGNSHGKKSLANAVNTATIESAKKAREEEQAKQEKVNVIAKIQYDEMAVINAALTNDIAGLHKRISRKNLPKSSEPRCTGTSGASLSSEDAGFLTREIARADRLRIGLKACYKYADEVVKGK